MYYTGNVNKHISPEPHPLTTKRGWAVDGSFLIKYKLFGVAGTYGLGLRAGQVQLISYSTTMCHYWEMSVK